MAEALFWIGVAGVLAVVVLVCVAAAIGSWEQTTKRDEPGGWLDED